MPDRSAARGERALNDERGKVTERAPIADFVNELKPSLVDGLAVQHSSLGGLQRMVLVQPVNRAGEQVLSADALILDIIPGEAVSKRQGVVRVELVVETRADAKAILWDFKDAAERVNDGQRIGRIENHRVD